MWDGDETTQPRFGGGCGKSFGGHSERETPGYIPNPEAKTLSADGTAGGTLWESRTPPDNYSESPQATGGFRRLTLGMNRRLDWHKVQ